MSFYFKLTMEDIIKKAKDIHILTKEEIISLLNSDGELLYKAADEVRRCYVGDDIHLRGLIEFTNICRCTCKYCGIRGENKNIHRYRLSKEAIIHLAQQGVQNGFRTIVLQGGEDLYYDKSLMCEIISEIKNMDVAITLSIGEKSYEEYKAFKDAGADRYLLRIETTDKELYKTLHPNMDFDNRVRCLKDLKALGYETGTGCLIGLPGQSIESLADDILFFKDLNADMIGVGPFLPHPDTPLKNEQAGSFDLALKVMAITRLLLPDINIPATTAMETINPNGRMIALQSGANVFMPNITGNNSEDYEIYPNKAGINGTLFNIQSEIENKLKPIGRRIAQDKGFRRSKT